MQEYNIEVGDRVTYIDNSRAIIVDATDLETLDYAEILKIERPKYEVIEEKKELLTEEEKEFLKQAIKFANYGKKGNGKIEYIKQFGYYIEFYFSSHHCNAIYIDKDIYFRGLTEDEEYTLSELRIGGIKK